MATTFPSDLDLDLSSTSPSSSFVPDDVRSSSPSDSATLLLDESLAYGAASSSSSSLSTRDAGRRSVNGGAAGRTAEGGREEGGREAEAEGGKEKKKGESSLMARLGSRGAGAMTGAVATSLLMTPFDVLKTRLQSRPPPQQPKYTYSSPPVPLTANSCCSTTLLNRPTLVNPNLLPPPLLPSSSSSASSTSATAHRAHQLYCSSTSTSSDVARLLRNSSSSSAGAAAIRLDLVPPVGCESPAGWRRLIDDFRTGKLDVGVGGNGKGKGVALGGFWEEVQSVRRESGIRGLWKGVGTTLSMGVPSSALYMLGYTHLNLHLLSLAPNSTSLSLLSPLFAGAISRGLSVTLLSPLELFRTRLQALPAPHLPPPTVKSTLEGLSAMVKKRGVRTLWRGLGATLWRDVPFSAIYWAGYEVMKLRVLTGPTWVKGRPGGKGEWARAMVAGASSGMVAAFITTPFDVLKTRRQVFVQRDPNAVSPTSSSSSTPKFSTSKSKSHSSARRPAVPGTFSLLLGIVKTEGPQALFAGLAPRLIKVAPACAIMISCYEGVGSWLEGDGGYVE